MRDDDLTAELLARMTPAEKIGQLNLLSAGEGPGTGSPQSRDVAARLAEGRLGGLFGCKSVASVRAWQELALEGSRLRIPLLFAEDVIHGHRTVFPLPIALACSFDLALIRATARVAAVEASAEGIAQVYAPMIDVCRDPRWGRIAESPGEDPFLAARYAEAMVAGLQGDDLAAPDAVAACLKHFIAYGAAEGGRDYANASMSIPDLLSIYAEPFRAGVAAGALSVMASFNAVNGTPMHAHRGLIEGWLRGECGFDGLVVADYTGVMELGGHGLGDRDCITARALTAGVDMDMIGEDYIAALPGLLERGLTRPEAGIDVSPDEIAAALDRACGHVLRIKRRLGLFDDPFNRCHAEPAALAPDHRALARRAAAECCVLLKNETTLPLRPGAKVALIGALADDRANMLGTWAVSGDPAQAPTLLESLRETHDGDVVHAKGCDLCDDPEMVARLNVFGPIVHPDDRPAPEMIAEAVAAARAADVAVLVAGEAKEHSGESSSTTDLRLSAPQRRLIDAVKATGTPLVLVILSGRPMALEREAGLADALLYGWFGGTEGASGLADALTGRTPPAGRLSATLPRRTGQIPVHHGAAVTGRPWRGAWEKFRTGYLDLPADAPPAGGLYPFGHGLTYTRFDWGGPQADRSALRGMDDRLTVSVAVTNAGERAGAEVVQLYVTDPEASVVRPSQELRGFEKLRLAPGETGEARFTLTADDLAFVTGDSLADARRVFEPGRFLIHVGPNARDLRTVEIAWTL